MSRDLEKAIDDVNDQIGKLTIHAERDGQVIGLPHHETIGQYLKPGKPFCQIGDPHKLEAHMLLDQADRDLIKSGRVAWMKIYGDSEVTWKSKVDVIAERNREEIPPELSNTAGGEVATKKDPKSGQDKPISAMYEVIIPVDNPDLVLQPGLRGFAKIDGGTYTFGWWLWRLITKTFHFTL
jgi:putative peptide zinc metalloprotease protein